MDTNFITAGFAAKELGCSPRRVRAMINAGRFPSSKKVGAVWLVTREDLDKVKAQKPATPPAASAESKAE